MILFVLAAASSFSWATIGNLPQRVVTLMQAIGNDPVAFMIGSIVVMVVLSSLLEGLPALHLGPDPRAARRQIRLRRTSLWDGADDRHGPRRVHPADGDRFYVCCAVMRDEIGPAARAMVPYLAVLVVGLLLVAFVPWFTVVLPRAYGFAG